ncbi:hypothetical protein NQ317_007588 [Molorchus minor]|uniref:Arrestin C-terminal-like domain-containing protein n=1 Tax=Molorchus minor TaxID=1323400 RepID=A0ABQ9JA23_9CUCU|nr:hypothetical protein NQ317_007588 [Molorchus minor]
MSNTNIEGLHLEMSQTIKCLVDDPSKSEKEYKNTLVDLNEVGLGAHGEHTYSFSVMLPNNVPLPNFALCKLFKVEYIYRVEARLPSMHTDLKILMYPEVGHIQINQAPNYPGGFTAPTTGGYAPSPGIPTPHHPPVGGIPVYPSLTPTAPFSDNSKYLGNAGEPNTNIQSEQPPPSYDSLRTN